MKDWPHKIKDSKEFGRAKGWLKILIIAVVCLIAGAYLHKCQTPGCVSHGATTNGEVRDTVIVRDTIKIEKPAVSSSSNLGYLDITVSTSKGTNKTDTLPNIRADTDTAFVGSCYASDKSINIDASADNDSVKIKLPIVQNVYEDADYKAYVSGVCPSLDSIFVYPRREIVTIKKPPKRWHIGPTVGYGYTPHGFEPFIGVSITYSLFSF